MKELGLGKEGCGIMPVVGHCNSAHKAMILCEWQHLWPLSNNHPLSPFNFRDVFWKVDLQQMLKHDTKTNTLWKMVYVAHVPWVKVPSFLSRKENRRNVQYISIMKDHRTNKILKRLKPNNYQENMR